MGFFSRLKDKVKDIHDFERSHLKSIASNIKDNPKRLLSPVPMVDPIGTKIGNKFIGEDYDPLVNQMGGATTRSYQEALDRGIDIESGQRMHKIAEIVAGTIAGGQLGQLGGQGASSFTGQALNPSTQGALTKAVTAAIPVGTAALEDDAELISLEYQPWDPGPGEYLSPLARAGRRFSAPRDPYRYGQRGSGGEQSMVGAAHGGLARASRPRRHYA